MAISVSSDPQRGLLDVEIAGEASFPLNLGAVANPEGCTLMITRAWLYTVTPAAGAAALSVGIGATATTVATDILNGYTLNTPGALTAFTTFAQIVAAVTAMTTPILWLSTTFLTFNVATVVSTAYRGRLLVEYVRLN